MKYILEVLNKLGITKETAKRAGRTFLQAALSYFAVNIVVVDFSGGSDVVEAALQGLVISAIAAGIAAVMNREKTNVESECE